MSPLPGDEEAVEAMAKVLPFRSLPWGDPDADPMGDMRRAMAGAEDWRVPADAWAAIGYHDNAIPPGGLLRDAYASAPVTSRLADVPTADEFWHLAAADAGYMGLREALDMPLSPDLARALLDRRGFVLPPRVSTDPLGDGWSRAVRQVDHSRE